MAQSICSIVWYKDRYHCLYKITTKENHKVEQNQNGGQNTHFTNITLERVTLILHHKKILSQV